jgi:AraC-like DNA-binding protein
MNKKEMLTADLVSLPHPKQLLVIEPLNYPNPYDFHKPHRHDYFEVILVRSGEGRQLIDFSEHVLSSGQVFTVYPGQVHLMHRQSAEGLLIQFRKDVFEFIHPVKHYHLYFPDPVFNVDADSFQHLYDLTTRMMQLLRQDSLSANAIYKSYSYLQIILISLAELYHNQLSLQGGSLVTEYLSLMTQHARSRKKVTEYCSLLGCNMDKLNTTCKTALGKTALELLHEELLLEIRRLMLLSDLSLKEIAYELNFDSPANFSGFIKTNTGLTPSELQGAIWELYK